MNALLQLLAMLRSPRRTLGLGLADPRPAGVGVAIVLISAACSVGFLTTRVGRLAALDQQVRELESVGTVVTDQLYGNLRELARYRPLINASAIVVGWPLLWAAGAGLVVAVGKRAAAAATYAQVLTVLVYASS